DRLGPREAQRRVAAETLGDERWEPRLQEVEGARTARVRERQDREARARSRWRVLRGGLDVARGARRQIATSGAPREQNERETPDKIDEAARAAHRRMVQPSARMASFRRAFRVGLRVAVVTTL